VSGAVRLRDVTEADLAVLFEQQLDPEAVRLANFPSRDRDAFFTHWQRILADETVGKKTVLLDGAVAGNVVSWQTPDERLVGYWIGKEFWGRGVATRALREFLHLETARPLLARVAKHNLGSIRVLEKCGFTVAGEDVADGVEELVMKLDGEEAPSSEK
jgi:RimJ/RimL family protein N-acetyltransferase